MSFYIGFDLGTSGARISIIDRHHDEVYTDAVAWTAFGSYDDPQAWTSAVESLLRSSSHSVDLQQVQSICFSGTSASCLIVDGKNAGQVKRSPRMYNYNVLDKEDEHIHGVRAMDRLASSAPDQHTTQTPTSSLAKLLAWHERERLRPSERLCHQSDYMAAEFLYPPKVCGSARNQRSIASDWHNVLKLGYDVRRLEWPSWLEDCLSSAGIAPSVLPAKVVSPGEPMGVIDASVAERVGLSLSTVVVGGTTDSNAAFFAAVGSSPTLGTAVVSLGSTLAIKQLSSSYVEDASVGVYSHRFPSVLGTMEESWLVGGASNVGCAVLRAQGFSNDELVELSKDIDPSIESPLAYYPLVQKGERFPVADSNKEPVLEPKPASRSEYLHGILQGISDVERDGFLALARLGAEPKQPTQIWSSGGGSRNDMWAAMRQRRLSEAFGKDVTVAKALNVEASYGAALLAAATFT